MQINYRTIKEEEYHFLNEMLYEAIFVPAGKPQFPKSIIEAPGIKKYLACWNTKKDDIAIVAVYKEELVGSIWGRKFEANNKGYGYIDEGTPEIGMAVKERYRNIGIGTELLNRIEIEYLRIGIDKISLSVDKRNPAKLFYERNGYAIYEEQGTALTMIKELKNLNTLIDN